MHEVLSTLDYQDYILAHKIFLFSAIILGGLILKLLVGREQKFMWNDRNLLLLCVVFYIIFAGSRDTSIGIDTINYYNFFFLPATQISNFFELFKYSDVDYLFGLIIALTAWTNNYSVYLFTVAIIFNVSLYKFVRKFTNYSKDGSGLFLFLTIASGFTFVNLELNIVRNGLAIGFILLALHNILEHQLRKSLLLFGVAYLFHRTTIIPFVLILVIYYFKNLPLKYFYILYVAAIGLSLSGLGFHSVDFLASLGSDDLANLSFAGETDYKIGFRPDFVAYNTLFLALFLIFSKGNSFRDKFLIKYYIATSAIFFLNFYIPYSDRFGVYSWIAIPLLLYNTINERYPLQKLTYGTLITLGYFIINNVILFP